MYAASIANFGGGGVVPCVFLLVSRSCMQGAASPNPWRKETQSLSLCWRSEDSVFVTCSY